MLWRTGADTFRVMQTGEPVDLLTNCDYLLFHEKYKDVLGNVGTQMRLNPVLIVDKSKEQVWRNYLEATIAHSASLEEVLNTSPAYPVICRFGEESIFVSEPLKRALEQIAGQQLSFSLGLSHFAA